MKKYFNGKGTITGWTAILRGFVPAILINVLANPALAIMLGEGYHDISPIIALPVYFAVLIASVWFILSTGMKRLRAYGWTGGFLNFLFPNLTDATYPNGKQSEE